MARAIGIAETGSGKTLAYALPILHYLKTKENAGEQIQTESRPRALVLVPTRELGEQVSKVFKLFTHTTRLRVRTVLGGADAVGIGKKTFGHNYSTGHSWPVASSQRARKQAQLASLVL